MGYYSKFSLDVGKHNKDLPMYKAYISAEAGYHSCFNQEVKWYMFTDDMKKISSENKEVLFELTVIGEDVGDFNRYYFLDGKMQVAKGKIVYEEFCKEKLV